MATSWVSHISGPIPAHPLYETKSADELMVEARPKLRVRPDGALIAEGHRGAVGPLLQLHGLRLGGTPAGSGRKTGSQPKDHLRENVRRMRELQRASKLREEERRSRQPIKSAAGSNQIQSDRPGHRVADWLGGNSRNCSPSSSSDSSSASSKSSSPAPRYDHRHRHRHWHANGDDRHYNGRPYGHSSRTDYHRGRCYPDVEPDTQATYNRVARPRSADFLRAHEKTGPIDLELSGRPITPIRKEPRPDRLSVPKAASAREVRLIRRDINFVRVNAHAAKSARIRRSPSLSQLDDVNLQHDEEDRNYRRGELPDYLVRRRKQWSRAEEERIASQPDPDQPVGHRRMPEKERTETLELLRNAEKDLLTELGRLPIRTDTLRVRTRKETIERKLSEIEEAMRIFSKPKVFIRID